MDNHIPRLRAFLVHLFISSILLIIMCSIVYLWWYPGALTFASGGLDGMKIVIGVDMVLGPLLTLVAYNITKPRSELVKDLTIIALIQISCLIAGMAIVYQERPLAVVYYPEAGFKVYNRQELEMENIEISRLDDFQGDFPKILHYVFPEDTQEAVDFTVQVVMGVIKIPIDHLYDLPDEPEMVRKLLSGESEDCIKQDISMFANKGTICFNPDTQAFSNYAAAKP